MKSCPYTIKYITLSGRKNMARGQRKSIEEKIQQKQEVIDALEVRLEHEKEELEALIGEQKQKEVETLYDFIKTSNLDVYEATEALQQYVADHGKS